MKLERLILLTFVSLLWSCGATQKGKITMAQKNKLDSLVAQKSYVFNANQALPLMTNSMNSLANAGFFPPGSLPNQVNLTGNGNYVKVLGDSLSADLPYFGERQMGGGYNTEGSGITFKGNAERYEAKFDKKNQRYDVQFRIRNKMEMFNVRLMLFPNMTGSMSISSNQRFAIRYNGKISEVERE
ncbi:DUF4251 domain-containing protein [Pareuzebyella sediminis]|uniref:DUF4251 domain-containing protein n=1 Tax=Pareuzebyella sediminis TaxID=2607998 RepID=UPI0011EDD885|nr:DUF4251 domain-containing protein [Pareuzebyella sediminis]